MGAVFTKQNTVYKGSFASDTAVMTGGGGVALGIVQNMQIQFAQQIARIYDITNGGGQTAGAAVFFVGGRTNGQLTLARVVGPDSTALGDFYTTYSDVCLPKSLSFSFGASCASAPGATTSVVGALAGAVAGALPGVGQIVNGLAAGFNALAGNGGGGAKQTTYSIEHCVLTNVGITVAAQDMIINESCTLMFANLKVT